MSAGIGAFAAAGVRRLPVADGDGRLRPAGQHRQARRHQAGHQATARASSTPRRPARGSRPTRPTPCRRRAPSTPPSILAGMEQGIVALYQKCPHLGCRVPQCVTSQWFECPCHGSQYNQVGEKKAGPGPRGMDRFPITVAGNGDVTVNTGTDRARARRSARTRPARRPRARTASPAAGRSTDGSAGSGDRIGDDVDRVDPLRDHRRRLDRLLLPQQRARRARRSARRSSWPPTASRTTPTRCWRASGSSASSCTACCCSS